jgi:hypothetical protein
VVRKPDQDGYYCAPGTCHYNVHFKGGVLRNRVTARDFGGLPHANIDWVWIVEEKRRATPDEIRKLCKVAPKR